MNYLDKQSFDGVILCMWFVNGKHFYLKFLASITTLKLIRLILYHLLKYAIELCLVDTHGFFSIMIYQFHHFVSIFKNVYSQSANLEIWVQVGQACINFYDCFPLLRVSLKYKRVRISELWAFRKISLQLTDLGRNPRVLYIHETALP